MLSEADRINPCDIKWLDYILDVRPKVYESLPRPSPFPVLLNSFVTRYFSRARIAEPHCTAASRWPELKPELKGRVSDTCPAETCLANNLPKNSERTCERRPLPGVRRPNRGYCITDADRALTERPFSCGDER